MQLPARRRAKAHQTEHPAVNARSTFERNLISLRPVELQCSMARGRPRAGGLVTTEKVGRVRTWRGTHSLEQETAWIEPHRALWPGWFGLRKLRVHRSSWQLEFHEEAEAEARGA